MMTTGSFAVVAAYISCSVGKTARDSKFARFGDLYGAIKRNRAYLEEV